MPTRHVFYHGADPAHRERSDLVVRTDKQTSWAIPLLCAVLRGESPSWPWGGDQQRCDEFLSEARTHGVTALLSDRLAVCEFADWPSEIRRTCLVEAIAHGVHDEVSGMEIARVIEALAAAEIAPLILKGSALAYTHYVRPALRPRSDTDVLLPPGTVDRANHVLRRLGYAVGHGVSGETISYQATWSRIDARGKSHCFDVHWRINNSQLLSKALTYAELEARARSVGALGAHARAPAPVDALLIACLHRAGHVNVPYEAPDATFVGGDRLIWLYDIHLLVIGMSSTELCDLAREASAKRLKAVCLDALVRTRGCFDTYLPSAVLDGLRPSGDMEPSARYLSGGRWRQLLGDFLAFDSTAERVTWVKELCFPSADYMRRKYPAAWVKWTPVLYARRAGRGVLDRLASKRTRPRGGSL